MKMKTKNNLIALIGVLLICLVSSASSTQADVLINTVDYPESITVGESIQITVSFTYDTPINYLHGSRVYAYYSINSQTIPLDAPCSYAGIDASIFYPRPTSVIITIPGSSLEDGDTLYFEIRYAWASMMFEGVYSEVSPIYEIAITGEANTGIIPAAGLLFAFATLATIVIFRKRTR